MINRFTAKPYATGSSDNPSYIVTIPKPLILTQIIDPDKEYEFIFKEVKK
jgi:hypothetical protein